MQKKITLTLNLSCKKCISPKKNSKYASFQFYGILGISGSFVTIFGDKNKKIVFIPWLYVLKYQKTKKDFCHTTIHKKFKLSISPKHLWSNLSIHFWKMIPCFLRLLCSCQHSVRPTPRPGLVLCSSFPADSLTGSCGYAKRSSSKEEPLD